MAKRCLKSLNHSEPIQPFGTCIVSTYFVLVIERRTFIQPETERPHLCLGALPGHQARRAGLGGWSGSKDEALRPQVLQDPIFHLPSPSTKPEERRKNSEGKMNGGCIQAALSPPSEGSKCRVPSLAGRVVGLMAGPSPRTHLSLFPLRGLLLSQHSTAQHI